MIKSPFYQHMYHNFQDLKIGLIPSVILTILIVGGRWFGILQTLEWSLLNTLMQWSHIETTDPRIAIVAIDEATIQAAGHYPLSDRQLLELLQNIQAQHPRTIALDLFRDLPTPPGTSELQQFVATQNNLFGIEKVLPITINPPLGFPAERVGFTDAYIDPDGIQRRTILGAQTKAGFKFSLAVLLAQDYLQQYDIFLDNGDRDPTAMQFGNVEIPRFYGRTGGYVQSNKSGAIESLIHFRRGQQPFLIYSAQDILTHQIPPNALKNRIVLIGLTSPSTSDYFNAPVTSSIYPAQNLIYGVELQAHALSQLLSAVLDQRPLIRSLSESLEYLWILAWGSIGLLLSALEKSPVKTVFWTSLSELILIGICYSGFLWGWWLPLAPSAILLGLNGLVLTAFFEYDRSQKLRLAMQEQAIALLAVNNEILESKVAQRTAELEQAKAFAEASSLAKSHFLAHMSHELRTPLNSILGFSQLLSIARDIEPRHQERIALIYRSGSHLLSLINNILDLAKIESGKQEVVTQPFQINDIFDLINTIFRLQIEQKGVEFICQVADNCPQEWRGDRQKIEQVLINLIGNALKFTERGFIRLELASENQQLTFTVTDSGGGIAPEDMQKLFIAFEQTASGKAIGQGTGLGLAISSQLVQLMGGKLQVTSALDQGTTFFFTLPLEQIQQASNVLFAASSVTEINALRPVLTLETAQQYCQKMDPMWQIEIKQAIASLNGRKINHLIDQLGDDQQALKDVLMGLAKNYAFDQLELLFPD